MVKQRAKETEMLKGTSSEKQKDFQKVMRMVMQIEIPSQTVKSKVRLTGLLREKRNGKLMD